MKFWTLGLASLTAGQAGGNIPSAFPTGQQWTLWSEWAGKTKYGIFLILDF